MTTLKITPAKLTGNVCVPSSKSMGHREIICAGLADGSSIVDNISMSADMEATLRCLDALGISFTRVPSAREGRTALAISGSGTVRLLKLRRLRRIRLDAALYDPIGRSVRRTADI